VNSERGLIAAACDRSDFPDQIDQQLLSVAANNAATAFQNARLINESLTSKKLCAAGFSAMSLPTYLAEILQNQRPVGDSKSVGAWFQFTRRHQPRRALGPRFPRPSTSISSEPKTLLSVWVRIPQYASQVLTSNDLRLVVG